MTVSADHPHTDPGDGRTECQRCGKFVWPVIHSCKGVPVTEAARLRFEVVEPEPTCDAPSPGGRMRCEYPPGHASTDFPHHYGRDEVGRWRSWLDRPAEKP